MTDPLLSLLPTPQLWLRDSLLYIMELALCGLIFLAVERVRPIHTHQAFTAEKRMELWLALVNRLLFYPASYVVIVMLLTHSLGQWLPYQIFGEQILGFPLWAQAIIGVFIMDMITYVRHRFMHRFMWRTHAIHHSAVYINWLTSARLHPVEIFVSLMFGIPVMHVIGFSGKGIEAAAMLALVFNLFTHANLNFEWPGFMRYILGSPNWHRWHHAKLEKEAFDKNFGAVFPFIDVAFGTFYHPPKRLPAEYGIYHRPNEMPVPQTLPGQLTYPYIKRR